MPKRLLKHQRLKQPKPTRLRTQLLLKTRASSKPFKLRRTRPRGLRRRPKHRRPKQSRPAKLRSHFLQRPRGLRWRLKSFAPRTKP
ncbi:hypothetical protein GUJ93_ZPchr0012g19470 [Zizania palustris]|uniref:Uncharacterized protein n=1 Tax=Zizania palustris TaxID=103762 RepID=A0A8J5WXQ8_ZIZPA|nr:hypothetical protein GUJ93_ZPchr0012g19470 [Zizania palustris]